MIIDSTYFRGKILIPGADVGITDSITNVADDLTEAIEEYEHNALIKCLGYVLYKELVSNIDINEESLIKSGSDEKWDHLVNGREYENSQGETVYWKGLRYKRGGDTNKKPNLSLLAYYVYYFHERDGYITRSGIGHQIEKNKNAEMVTPTMKVTYAWREFIKHVYGERSAPKVFNSSFGVGLDFFKSVNEVGLYTFINDANILVEDTYAGFSPERFDNVNQFGI